MSEPQTIYKNGVQATLAVMGNKWKPLILCHLGHGPMRTADVRRAVAGISPKVLTDQLRELENDGIIARKVYNEVPPHVEYSVTEYGKSLNSVLIAMSEWGEDRIKILQAQGKNANLLFPDHDGYEH
ncbi:winged helix-turn-helix transcriptional regulator [Furfurilactobacillus sp. WILCCON 0119]|uniref:winged helix-turn-helix transcriptional regulator n=1 Tax=Furfurilactobacillus entadae TaxID=2922307 RepID=UPI0035EB1B63